MTYPPIKRRLFLRDSGVALSLPMLAAMTNRGWSGDDASTVPRRMLAINKPLGIYAGYLFPQNGGVNYDVTPYLEPLQSFRDRFTLVSGLQFPGVDGGHSASKSFLTGAQHPGRPSFKNSVSLDQYAAEQIGHRTRFDSLVLGIDGSQGLSWTRGGVQIPADDSPSRVFGRLFLDGSKDEVDKQIARLRDGQSIMDTVFEQAKGLQTRLGGEDRQTLNQYFDSVRDLESKLVKAEEWAKKPKPKIGRKPPSDIQNQADFVARTELMYDIVHLAFQTDSTRLITIQGAGGAKVVPLEGVEEGWHPLSHHGKDPDKLAQLKIIEVAEMELLAGLLKRLADSPEGDETLLDRTTILFGSNLGDASSHHNRDLPMIAAGGPFRHAGHLKFEGDFRPPLTNIYVSALQGLGIATDQFASGTGTLQGLQPQTA